MGFAERILECPMEVIEGVPETLEYLAHRHDLTLCTKGHPEEQRLKIERSGLGAFFAHAAIVKEKDAAAYRALARERGFDPGLSWMIGNSPARAHLDAGEAGDRTARREAAGGGALCGLEGAFLEEGRWNEKAGLLGGMRYAPG